jgi:hypothetical protein
MELTGFDFVCTSEDFRRTTGFWAGAAYSSHFDAVAPARPSVTSPVRWRRREPPLRVARARGAAEWTNPTGSRRREARLVSGGAPPGRARGTPCGFLAQPVGASPTSAVDGGHSSLFGQLAKKSALHFGGEEEWGVDAEPLRKIEAEPGQEVRLGQVRADDTPEAEVAAINGREDDVGALDAAEFFEDGAGAVAQARPALPLLQGLPQHVGEEADEDVGPDPVFALMPDGADGQVALVNAKGGLRIGQLDVGAPEVLRAPGGDVGAEDVAALAGAGPVFPLGADGPGEAHPRGHARVGGRVMA